MMATLPSADAGRTTNGMFVPPAGVRTTTVYSPEGQPVVSTSATTGQSADTMRVLGSTCLVVKRRLRPVTSATLVPPLPAK